MECFKTSCSLHLDCFTLSIYFALVNIFFITSIKMKIRFISFSKDPKATGSLSRTNSLNSIFALGSSADSPSPSRTGRTDNYPLANINHEQHQVDRMQTLSKYGTESYDRGSSPKTIANPWRNRHKSPPEQSLSSATESLPPTPIEAGALPKGSNPGLQAGLSSTYKEAALVVHERVVIVTPRVLISKSAPPSISSSTATPVPSFNEAKELANIANNIAPITAGFSQVTVTDEDTQSQVELDFSTPTPPSSAKAVDFTPKQRKIEKKPIEYTDSLDYQNSNSHDNFAGSDGAFSGSRQDSVAYLEKQDNLVKQQQNRRKSVAVNDTAKQRQPLGSRKYIESDDEIKTSTMGSRTPRRRDASPERPSWGFGNSRVPSRQDMGHEYNDYGALYERSPSRNSRAPSRAGSRNSMHDPGLTYEDIIRSSSNTLQPGRKLTRQDSKLSISSNVTSRWKEELQNYQAIKTTIYKNGDQWFEGFELRFRPAKDYRNLEVLLAKISPKINFTASVAYLFDTDGNRIRRIEDMEDGQSFVASSSRKFVPANYGRTGDAFWLDGGRERLQKIAYRRRSAGSKSSSSDGKPGSGDGRIIKIINNDQPSLSERVLLNLKTTQPFEEVIKDLGQVLKLKDADRMYSLSGKEVKSFSHLRQEFSDDEAFAISSGPAKVDRSIFRMSRRNSSAMERRKSRSMSASRDSDSDGKFKILIKGVRKIYHAPSNLPPEDSNPPDQNMDLEWVYGYRGADQNRNLWVLEKGELVYYVGAVVVIYSRMDEKQMIYQGHDEDIQCMDVHPSGTIAASGQKSGVSPESQAHIRVWDMTTLQTITVLGFGECENGISAVSFSVLNKGMFVAAVDASRDRILSVWDWEKNSLLAQVVTKVKKMCGLAFHPFDNNLIITHGSGHLCFWSRRKDSFFESVNVAEKDSPDVTFNTITFLESGDLIAGDSEGCITSYSVTSEGEYFRSMKYSAHEKGISCVLLMVEGTLLSSGEKDRSIKAWDSNRDFEKVAEAELPSSAGSARTMHPQWPGRADASIYVGTVKNIILEGSLQKKFNMILFGHSSQLNNIATHPSDISFVTVGADKIVSNWRRSKLIWKLQIGSEGLCAAFHPQGTVVAVGTSDGNMIIIRTDSGDHVTTTRVCGTSITAIKFCLDGDLVAAASHNGSIYLYKSSRDGFSYKKHGKVSGGQQLQHLDWDEESEYLQTCSTDFNQNFWSSVTNKMEKVGSVLREKVWVDQTCPVGWAVSGLWNNHNYQIETTLSCLHVGPTRTMVASGDTEGFVRIARYPVTSPKAEFCMEKVVSGPVNSLRFLYDESYLLGVGGVEGAIYKWRLK